MIKFSLLRKAIFLFIVLASLFVLAPIIFFFFPVFFSNFSFFNRYQFLAIILAGLLIASSYGLIAYFVVFLFHRFKSELQK